jgi:hypothetical protein
MRRPIFTPKERMRMKIRYQTRNYQHECKACEFLGECQDEDGTILDLYLHEWAVVFRYGNHPEEQRGIPMAFLNEYSQMNNVYEEGFKRALLFVVLRN